VSLLGIDIGTTGVRALVADETGRTLASAARTSPLEIDGGRAETDARAVADAVDDAIREVLTRVGEPIAALSFSTQGEAVVPVDAAGEPLAPAPVSMDRRGDRSERLVARELGDGEFTRITGQPSHPMFSVHKIAGGGDVWHDDAVARYLTLDGHVACRLGAEAAIDLSMAARTGLLDVEARAWSDAVIDAARAAGAARLGRGLLPRVVAAGEVIGAVSAEAAARTGLPAGIPIVAGVHDQAAAYLGAGGSAGARSAFSLGSSDCLTVGSPARPGGLGKTGFASYPISDSTWLTLAGTAAGGWALDWFARIIGAPVGEVFDDPAPSPSPVLVLPYLTGSGTLDNDPSARGAIVGLTLDTTRRQLSRAFLESGAYELAKIVDALAELSGIGPGEIVAVGGGSANRTALGIRASAAGLALTPGPDHASARGAALIAGAGAGVFAGIDQLPAPLDAEPLHPDPDARDWYLSQRSAYRELYRALRPLTIPVGHTSRSTT
jgi:sugar (pentulose or hexulose) kinase